MRHLKNLPVGSGVPGKFNSSFEEPNFADWDDRFCPSCNAVSGFLGRKQAVVPAPSYRSREAGLHRAWLEGPEGTDFDLSLERWDGAEWRGVATSDSPDRLESLSVDSASGRYRWVVSSESGHGNFRLVFWRPSSGHEWEVLVRRMARRAEEQQLNMVVDEATLLAMQAAVETVVVDEDVGRYCVDLAVATRAHPQVQLGASPRGALALLLCARAFALIAGRDYVIPEDVKAVAPSALAHRISIKPELWLSKASGSIVTEEILAAVPTPTPEGRGCFSLRWDVPRRRSGSVHPA